MIRKKLAPQTVTVCGASFFTCRPDVPPSAQGVGTTTTGMLARLITPLVTLPA